MPNPPKKVPAGTRIPGQSNYRMTKSVYKEPASYMDRHEFDAETERRYQAEEAKRMRTTSASSIAKKLVKEGNRKFVGPMSNRALTAREMKYEDEARSLRGSLRMPPKKSGQGALPETRKSTQVPRAETRVQNLGFRGGLTKKFKGTFGTNDNPMTMAELKAAINRLPEASRQKLRSALAAGLGEARIPF